MSPAKCLLSASMATSFAFACLSGAGADSLPPAAPAEAATAPSTAPTPGAAGPFGFLSAASNSPNLLGDMWGLRPALDKYGMSLNVIENAETFGNLTGGVRQGFEVNGLTTATLQLDTKRAFGLNGGLFNVSGLHIWGGQLSPADLLNFQTATAIEAFPSIRLWELWYQQSFGDKFDIKIGEQSLDYEFKIIEQASHFINGSMGWPVLPTVDLPGGGPAYPLAGLGVRGRAKVTDNVTVLAGLFNGSPIPRNSPNTELSNPNGVSFPLNTGVFAIAELQCIYGVRENAKEGDPLPGALKIGFWYDSYNFNDLQYDTAGVPLASPASSGIPAVHRGNYAIYAAVEQTIWRSKDPSRSISVDIRPMFTPLQDRNLISFGLNAGLIMHEPFLGRDDDIVGLGMGIARVSSGASGFDRNLNVFDPTVHTSVRSAETFVEATYQYQAAKWWQIQPDIQYVFNPGGGLANPNDPGRKIKNELVIGLRTNITF
jgi:porin